MEAFVLAALLLSAAVATASPSPAPSSGPVHVSAEGILTALSQSASGPGTVLPFTLGSPNNPQTPYELFTGTQGLTGTGAQAQLYLNVRYDVRHLVFGLEAAAGSYSGSTPNILYLGESVMPTANPFVSSRTQLFHTPFGAFDAVGTNRSSILSGSAGAADGSWKVTGGWFLPAESLNFVFAPPPLQNTLPAIAPQLPETLTPRALYVEGWNDTWSGLPLQGVDATAHRGDYTGEFFEGALPAPYYSPDLNNSARVASLLFAYTSPGGARFAIQGARVAQNNLGVGNVIPAAVMWGANEETEVGAEGPQPQSDVYGQRSTVAGFSAAVPIGKGTSFLADAGRSWFSAQFISVPGQPTPGGYYHAGIAHTWGKQRFTLDAYRFDPTYAPNILPYGNIVNNWPVAWSWPSNWLKFDYQLVANEDASINRQGFDARYAGGTQAFEYSAGYANFAQVTPYDNATARLPGFTDPFFTSSDISPLSYRGRVQRASAWAQWNTRALQLSLDYVEDFLRRDAPAGDPQQAIHLDLPQAILTLSRATPDAVYAVGEGRFSLDGCYAVCGVAPVQLSQRVFFAGINFDVKPRSRWLLEWRRYITDGAPFSDLSISPAYTGTRVILEQRFTVP